MFDVLLFRFRALAALGAVYAADSSVGGDRNMNVLALCSYRGIIITVGVVRQAAV